MQARVHHLSTNANDGPVKWGRWRLKAGETHVWVCNIPGHAYTTNNVEVVSTKTGQPTTGEITAGLKAAGLEVNSDVPTE
eukprot:gene26463-32468_t